MHEQNNEHVTNVFYNKRTKWNRKKLEDVIISQKFKHDMKIRFVRQAESLDIQKE
jgi:hypothetical protein